MNMQEQNGITGTLTITKLKNGKVVSVQEETNKVVSSNGYGRNLLVRQLTGDTTYNIQIDEAKIGDDGTAPVDGDTDLGNAVLSNIVVETSSFSNDECSFSFFILDGDLPDGTYREFGLFIDGQMFSRALFNTPYAKSASEDTRIDYRISIN